MRHNVIVVVGLMFLNPSTAHSQAPAAVPPVSETPRPSNTIIGSSLLGFGLKPQLYSKSTIVALPEVIEELKLSESQLEKIKELQVQSKRKFEQIMQEMTKAMEDLTKQNDADGYSEARARYLNYGRTLTREDERPLLKVLNRDQRIRLEQLQIQASGIFVFIVPMIPEVAEQLALEQHQVQEISGLFKQGRLSILAAGVSRDPNLPNLTSLTPDQRSAIDRSDAARSSLKKTRDSVVSARDATLRSILKVLSKSQQQRYKIMAGKPFDFGNPLDRSPPRASDPKKEPEDEKRPR